MAVPRKASKHFCEGLDQTKLKCGGPSDTFKGGSHMSVNPIPLTPFPLAKC